MLRITASPFVRDAITDEEWAAIRAVELDGFLVMLADSKRGPFTVKLAANGVAIRGEGSTIRAAIESVIDQVAA